MSEKIFPEWESVATSVQYCKPWFLCGQPRLYLDRGAIICACTRGRAAKPGRPLFLPYLCIIMPNDPQIPACIILRPRLKFLPSRLAQRIAATAAVPSSSGVRGRSANGPRPGPVRAFNVACSDSPARRGPYRVSHPAVSVRPPAHSLVMHVLTMVPL